MPPTERRAQKFRAVIESRLPDLTVVMENIHDPHNVSAILRSCDAVGVLQVELLYTSERFPRIGRKSSSSAGKWIDRRNHRSVQECFATLRREGFAIYATHLERSDTTLYGLDLRRPSAIVLGNEHRGVSEEVAGLADRCFFIPMRGMIQSLNVSVAAAVCLYEALRQRLAAGDLNAPAMHPARIDDLFREWIER